MSLLGIKPPFLGRAAVSLVTMQRAVSRLKLRGELVCVCACARVFVCV